MGTSTGTQGHAQAADASCQCPAPCAGVSGVKERCLTPVLGDGEDGGTRPGSPVRGKASLSQDEILLGVHEPDLPSSGPGDHCKREPRGSRGHGRKHCPSPSPQRQTPECSCFCFARRGPKVVPGVALPWCGCVAGSQPQPPCQMWCSPQTVLAGWARTQTHHKAQLATVSSKARGTGECPIAVRATVGTTWKAQQ